MHLCTSKLSVIFTRNAINVHFRAILDGFSLIYPITSILCVKGKKKKETKEIKERKRGFSYKREQTDNIRIENFFSRKRTQREEIIVKN